MAVRIQMNWGHCLGSRSTPSSSLTICPRPSALAPIPSTDCPPNILGQLHPCLHTISQVSWTLPGGSLSWHGTQLLSVALKGTGHSARAAGGGGLWTDASPLGMVGDHPLGSVQFSRSGVSDSLWPHGLQHARLPCPSPSPRVCPSSCPLHQWCHPTISSSDTLSSSCLQSFPASRSFSMSRLFTSGGQSIGVSASASVRPMNVQGWFL